MSFWHSAIFYAELLFKDRSWLKTIKRLMSGLIFMGVMAAILARGKAGGGTPPKLRGYGLTITTSDSILEGKLITAAIGDDIVGSLYGAGDKLFTNFFYSGSSNDFKLMDLDADLDKWYVRRTLTADLGRLVRLLYIPGATQGGKYEITELEDGIMLTNRHNHINYRIKIIR